MPKAVTIFELSYDFCILLYHLDMPESILLKMRYPRTTLTKLTQNPTDSNMKFGAKIFQTIR